VATLVCVARYFYIVPCYARCSGIECADCVMNVEQYRAVTKTELDIADHSDVDRPGDSGEIVAVAFIRRTATTRISRYQNVVCNLRVVVDIEVITGLVSVTLTK